jgi:hypothetical protein
LRPDFSTLSFNADIAVEDSPRRIYPVLVDPELALISVFLGLLFLEPDVQRAVLWNVSGELPTRQVQHSKQWPLFEVAGSVVADEFNIRVVQGETTVDGCHLHVDHQWREVLHGHKWSGEHVTWADRTLRCGCPSDTHFALAPDQQRYLEHHHIEHCFDTPCLLALT